VHGLRESASDGCIVPKDGYGILAISDALCIGRVGFGGSMTFILTFGVDIDGEWASM
jgi:hypothetical protein